MANQTMLDQIATDLALWLDQTATRIAAAMAPQGTAPFAAQLSDTQKLEYYRDQLFNPDGTPNVAGRQAQIARLGPQGFTQVYKAVIRMYPQLRIPTPPEAGAPPPGTTQIPTAVPGVSQNVQTAPTTVPGVRRITSGA